MTTINLRKLVAMALAAAACLAPSARATIIGGVDFPQGAVSFADAVWAFNPVVNNNNPTVPHLNPAQALGVPNYAGDNSCASQADCTFVSLGDGGSISLRFVDNLLTGSGDNKPDLWIFEVGPDVEDTFVEVSVDGVTWLSVGKVAGSTRSIDLDAFGYGVGSQFGFVRLRDDPLLDGQSGSTVGADIDAVGAISTIRVSNVPEPGSLALMLPALGLLVGAMARTRRFRA